MTTDKQKSKYIIWFKNESNIEQPQEFVNIRKNDGSIEVHYFETEQAATAVAKLMMKSEKSIKSFRIQDLQKSTIYC